MLRFSLFFRKREAREGFSAFFVLLVNRLEIRGLHLDEQPSKKER